MRTTPPHESSPPFATGGSWLGGTSPRVYRSSHLGDWLVLALFAVMPLATGLDIWLQLGWSNVTGRAAFGGLFLVAVGLAWAIYAYRIAIRVLVSLDGLAIHHGPRRWYLPWEEVNRLLERSQARDDQRYRWVVLEARDGRRLQVREDRVDDYARFRADVYAAYQAWREQSDDPDVRWTTWGGGLLVEREVSSPARWLGYLAVAGLAPGLYLRLLIPGAALPGVLLLACGALAACAGAGAWLRRQTVAVDAHGIEAHHRLGSIRLEWDTISRTERKRHPLGPAAVALAAALRTASILLRRPNPWTGGSPWLPRVPEELILRGAGRQIHVRLDRLEHPDAVLAQVEFYLRAAQQRAAQAPRPTLRASDGTPGPAAER
jgi:hypothetical protein